MINKQDVKYNEICIQRVKCPGCKSSYIKKVIGFLFPKTIVSRLYKCSCCDKYYFKTPYWYKPIFIPK